MEEQREMRASPPGRRRRLVLGVVSGVLMAALAGGIVVANLGVAAAQTGTPSPGTETPAIPGPGPGHGRGHGFGRGAIHGEFVTAAPNGGYQTLATQTGEVTSVNASSIAVESEDGFRRTYGVDDNTLVNAGNDGIGDVETGDTVRIIAVVDGNTARAVQIFDVSNVRELHGRWRPPAPAPATETASSA